jgi:4-diphosphocytidyl-2-C-methyl-D-erythritol kinase
VSDREITRRAYAKLNVSLRVIGSRDDGFHEIESLVLPVSLYDLVTVHSSDRLTLSVSGEAAATVPADETNLALIAARALAGALGNEPTGAIAIDKRIPVAAGLGGGSADAAATLLALRELWDVEIDDETMAAVAASVGSDVPALLVGSAALMTGRGERIEPVPAAPTWWTVLPFAFPVAVADAYSWWDIDGITGPEAKQLREAVASGAPESLATVLANDLQAPVVVRHPEIGEAIDAFLAAGAVGALMSGSGPTVAALAWNEAHAERLADAVHGAIVVTGPPGPGVG